MFGRVSMFAATSIVIAVNAAANLLPINGLTTGALSARNPTGFTPAGWVFSIWSLIYIGLIAVSIWAWRVRSPVSQRVDRIRLPYLASCVANVTWIFVWHYEHVLASFVVMLALLGSLVVVYARLRETPPRGVAERLCVDLPISLYLGWITAATIVNLAAVFFDRAAYPFGLQRDEWALVSVTLASAVYVAVGMKTRDALYVAVFTWASLGIARQALPIASEVRIVAATGCVVTALLALWLVITPGSRTARR